MNGRDQPFEPPTEEVAALVRRTRALPDPPPALEHAIFARLRQTLGLPGGGGGGDGEGSDGDGAPATPTAGGDAGTSAMPTAGNAATAAMPTAVGKLAAASQPWLRTLLVFAVGAGSGAAVTHALETRETGVGPAASAPAPARVPPPAPVEAVERPPEPPSLNTAPPPAAPAPDHPPAAAARAARVPEGAGDERDRDLAAERALIEQARMALARDRGDVALAALDRHAQAYPRGALEEERESLRVEALAGAGRSDQARSAGAGFHRRFPRSIFAPVVDEALRSLR